MPLIKTVVKRPVAVTIIVAVVMILGYFTFSRLTVDLYPEMKLPIAAVIVSYPGAGPEEVESQVTIPMEGTVTTLSNIKELQSISSAGQSLLIVTFNWGTNMDYATADIREKIGIIEKFLPSGADKPMIVKMDPTMMPIMQMGISGTDDLATLQSIAEDYIEPRLSRIPEVASVVITGGMEREVTVEVDPVKLENYGLTLAQVNQVLQMENFNMAGGKMEQGGREFFVRNLQQFESVSDIGDVVILTPTGGQVYLKDIATITDGVKDQSQITRVDGEYALGVHILKQSDANTVKTSQAVRTELEKIEKELDMDLNVRIVYDQADYIIGSIDNTKKMLYEGALLAALILFFFLRNMRSTLIIFTAIPLSIIATFILMYFTGNTVNLLTMGGLALGVGRIVDDSIVVFENIYRHRTLGLPPIEAAIKGASEVGGAVIASTTTIMAVFLPIVFVEGLAAIIFKPMAMTISFAIFCSLIVALTIIPLMSSRMLTDKVMHKNPDGAGRVDQAVNKFGGWIDGLGERYKVLLQQCLQRRRLVVVIVTVLMIGSFALMPLIGAEFLPTMDSGEISISIETDKGSKLASTNELCAQVEKELREFKEVETIFTSVGSQGTMMMGGSGENDRATMYVKLCSKYDRDLTVEEMAEAFRREMVNVAGAKIKVSVMDMSSMMSTGGGQINVQVRGDDSDVLRDLSDEIAEIIRSVPGTREVVATLTDGSPEMQVKIDRQRAASYGLTPMQISSEIKNAMEGSVTTRYKVEGTEIDVRVRYVPEGNKDINHLSNLTILAPGGAVVKLSQVASFEMAQGPISVNRIDQVRVGDINGYLLNRDLRSVMADIQAEIEKMNLPAGYTVEYGGQNQEMMESFGSLAIALLLALILVYAVMAVQYESFFSPFVIMFSVPTAIIGVVLGLLLTGRSFSVTAFIGIIMLVGIVVSNAIILVDYLNKLRERGMERDEAIVEAGRVRLRPILMTALTTILAMFPMTLALGEGGEVQAPLATVVVSGLLVSTLVTLVLVPVVYSIFDDWGQALNRRFKRNTPQQDTDLPVG